MLGKKISLLFLFSVLGLTSYSQSKLVTLDKYFTDLYKNKRFNGNILIAEHGKILYQKSFGYADLDLKKVNMPSINFPICSITKTFVTTAILQLLDQGKLKLSDKVGQYLSLFPYSDITIEHLLANTSGLPPYDELMDSLRIAHPDTLFTNLDILKRYARMKLPLMEEPGTSIHFSNINSMLASMIVEKISGLPFGDYVNLHILIPAGMTHTFFPKNNFYHWNEEEKKNLTQLYFFPHFYSENLIKSDTVKFFSNYWHAFHITGEGEMISTTGDLLKYDQALYNGKLISEKSSRLSYKPVPLPKGKKNLSNIGLNWMGSKDSSMGKIVRFSGGAIGIKTEIIRNISRNQTIILFDNTNNLIDEVGLDALKILNGKIAHAQGKSLAKIFGITLLSKGVMEARNELNKYKSDKINYSLIETEFNDLGEDLMGSNEIASLVEGDRAPKDEEALEVFKITTELFPKSWNAFDSYGEALTKVGNTEEAIKMYKKSIELNPKNENGKKALDGLIK